MPHSFPIKSGSVYQLAAAWTRRGPRATVARVDEREPLEQGRAAFNRGAFFEAHEHWEHAWRELDGAPRVAVQGLIQIAAGLHHLQQGRSRPAARLLGKGLAKLSRGAPTRFGDLRVDVLAGEVARLLAELEAPGGSTPDPRLPRL
jgi:predicted metal-dependent hydrolase